MVYQSIRTHVFISEYGSKGIYFMNFYSILLFIFFYVVNILVLGANQAYDPFYSMLAIAIPFENGAVVFSRLIFNYAIIMIFTFTIIHNLKQLFLMAPYILSRTSRNQMYGLFFRSTTKKTLWIVLIKLIADLLGGQINGLENVGMLLTFYASFLLTLVIWFLLILILYISNIGENKTIFTILFITFISQYLSLNIHFLDIFVVASPEILTDFLKWGMLKGLTVLTLLAISYRLFKNKEFIGDEKD